MNSTRQHIMLLSSLCLLTTPVIAMKRSKPVVAVKVPKLIGITKPQYLQQMADQEKERTRKIVGMLDHALHSIALAKDEVKESHELAPKFLVPISLIHKDNDQAFFLLDQIILYEKCLSQHRLYLFDHLEKTQSDIVDTFFDITFSEIDNQSEPFIGIPVTSSINNHSDAIIKNPAIISNRFGNNKVKGQNANIQPVSSRLRSPNPLPHVPLRSTRGPRIE